MLLLQPRGENGRIHSVTLFDVRAEKDFKLGEKVRLGCSPTSSNLLNDGHDADGPEHDPDGVGVLVSGGSGRIRAG